MAVLRGEQATDTGAPCDFCARLGRNRPPKRRHAPSGTGHGLRIALVDDDEDTERAAREVTRAQHDGWRLETYHPCFLVREASGVRGVSCAKAVKGDDWCGSLADIVLVGLSSRDDARLACVRRLKGLAPDLPVLIISDRRDGASIAQYCMAGADGWLIRPLLPAELARAVRAAAEGGPVLCQEAEKALLDFLHRAGATLSSHGLTRREREIVGCLAENLSNKEIAVRLGVSTDTVHVHLGHLFRKLGVHRREQAVRKLLGGNVTHL